jgi:aryl-alcohol dehydrogenase-like predicted oxidoreductase
LRPLLPAGQSLPQFALRWILSHPAVTCAIPGGKRASQVDDNMAAADLPPLSVDELSAVRKVYERCAKAQVHQRW